MIHTNGKQVAENKRYLPQRTLFLNLKAQLPQKSPVLENREDFSPMFAINERHDPRLMECNKRDLKQIYRIYVFQPEKPWCGIVLSIGCQNRV